MQIANIAPGSLKYAPKAFKELVFSLNYYIV